MRPSPRGAFSRAAWTRRALRCLVDAPTNRTRPATTGRGTPEPRTFSRKSPASGRTRSSGGHVARGQLVAGRGGAACGGVRWIGGEPSSPSDRRGSRSWRRRDGGNRARPRLRVLVPELTAFSAPNSGPTASSCTGTIARRRDQSTSVPLLLGRGGPCARSRERAAGRPARPPGGEARARARCRARLELLRQPILLRRERWTCRPWLSLVTGRPIPGRSILPSVGGIRTRAAVSGPGETRVRRRWRLRARPGGDPAADPSRQPLRGRNRHARRASRARAVPFAEEPQLGTANAAIARATASPPVPPEAPAHLLVDPAAVDGAVPGTEVDSQIRIDFAQPAGSALVRGSVEVMPGRQKPPKR